MKKTMSIAILSGKGGVGKSNLALNISAALNKKNKSVLLLDCDIGLANLDVLLGVAPEYTIQDVILGQKTPEEVCLTLQTTGQNKFDLLPGHSGLASFTELDAGMRKTTKDSINQIAEDYDILVLDLGAGIAKTIQVLASMTDYLVVVVTPEPTSLTDSYALIKVLSARYKGYNFQVIVNQTETSTEGKQTFERLAAACERFLNLKINYLGEVRHDEAVLNAVRQQKPFVMSNTASKAGADCLQLADKIIKMQTSLQKDNAEALNDIVLSNLTFTET